MAIRKLSPSLFSAKAGITQTEGSTQYLHFIAGVQESRNLYTLVCESQPLLSVTTFGRGKRCPFCSQDEPIGREIQAQETI